MNAAAGNIRNEEQLDDDLNDGNDSGDHDQQIRFTLEGIQRTGNNAEGGIDEQPESGDTQQDVVEVALFLAAELQILNAVNENPCQSNRCPNSFSKLTE